MRVSAAAAALLLLASCSGGGGGSPAAGGTNPPSSGSGFTDPVAYSSSATASLPGAQEIGAVTRHQVVIGGNTLDYTATAGHLTAVDLASSAPEASFFYVAYTLDGADPATRPLTFLYNGGPGSASVWLHLGSWAPKRIVTHAPSTTLPTPLEFADNAESLLDVAPKFIYGGSYGTPRSVVLASLLESAGASLDGVVLQSSILDYNTNCGV